MKILTLSGWSQPAEALRILAPDADVLDYIEHTPEHLHGHQLDYDVVIGWSLGGILARQMLQSGALKTRAFISIAAPYQFVRDVTYHAAMPTDLFEQFYSNFAADSLRTSARFHGLLTKGDVKARIVREHLGHHPRLHETEHWLRWLAFLRDYSARHHSYTNLPKTLLIHGAQDAIVPLAQGQKLSEMLQAPLYILPDAGHAPHLHDVQGVRGRITEFLS